MVSSMRSSSTGPAGSPVEPTATPPARTGTAAKNTAAVTDVPPTTSSKHARAADTPPSSARTNRTHGTQRPKEETANGENETSHHHHHTHTHSKDPTRLDDAGPGADDDALPSTLLVRHRMGFTVVKLSQYQKKHYGRNKLEDFVLYKEQKYNAVNTLSRFMLIFVFFLVVTLFCVAFCMSSPNWHLVRYRNYNAVMGIFTACTDRVFAQCTHRVSAHWERALVDTATGLEVCAVRGAFLRNYIGAMWSLAILQLLGLAILVVLAGWISSRPTRSRSLLAAVFISLICMFCNIINCVLFSVYVRCDRKTCQAHHLPSTYCEVTYMWGYRLYIACAALHAVVFLVAVSMYSYIQHIHVNAAQQLHRERSLRARQEFLNDYIRNLVETMTVEPDMQSLQTDTPSRPLPGDTADAGAPKMSTFSSPSDPGQATRRTARVPAEVRPEIERDEDTGTRMHLYVQFQPPGRPGSKYHSEADTAADGRTPVGFSSARASPATPALAAASSANADTTMTAAATTKAAGGKPLSPSASFAPTRTNSVLVTSQRRRQPTQRRAPSMALTGTEGSTTGAPRSAKGTTEREKVRKQRNIFQYIREHQNQLTSAFGRRSGDEYLTADELGIRITGAQDWLYDDRSDMYYSYELNMFWDPITREYYNCALQTWQEEPHQVVEIRDATELAQDVPFLNDFDNA